uniref:deoxyribonuclease II n=2 Tax=Pelodiscus sinensis TaxID=13735 RepID=K7FHC3_PELSI|nr:deoxyribonuclease-2-beta isoform X1 [Pelodiscus sinensis]|eukprot:XP_006120350.1 deoxyribonuclease-2-beta isoform X1 [Pelodiscus sinensis]
MSAGSLWSCAFLLLLSSIGSLWPAEISCRNEDGDPVDWFLLYKLPKYIRKESPGTGLEYMYMDSLMQAWQLSKFLINMTQSALGQTLNQLYEAYKSKNDSTAYVIYNDDVPHSKHYSRKQGHAKGFLLLDKSQGFWGIHSIPLFPPFPEEGYRYPPTGKQNAQMAICVTFRFNQFAEIDKQLLCYNPNIYNCSIPDIFHSDLPNLQKLCVGSVLPLIPWRHLSKLQSAQGENFLHFAKSRFFVDDIYVAWMAQLLQTDLLAESWQHDGQKLPSNCSLQHHVYNINLIKTPWNSTFRSYYDHSKWCVSWRYEDQWTCIGDLNRAPQQAWRGGGFICTQNQYIYKAFRHMIFHYHNCKITPEDGYE